MGFLSFIKKKKKNTKDNNDRLTDDFEVALKNYLKLTIKNLSKNEILIKTDELEKAHNSKCSRIGGKPYLPKDFIWPTHNYSNDNREYPLAFLCQINLEDISKYDIDNLLPKKGLLSFFYEFNPLFWGYEPDSKKTGNIRVFYYENIENFIEFELPMELEEEYKIPEISIDFHNRKGYPSFYEFEVFTNVDCKWDEYDCILEELGYIQSEGGFNRLLGYADIIQDEMITECEYYSRKNLGDSRIGEEYEEEIKKCATEWILLLQISSIEKDDFELMFGDGGCLYFYIKKSDLLEKNFDNVLCILQDY